MNAIVQVGNVVVIGGDFTEVREDGGAGPLAGAELHRRPRRDHRRPDRELGPGPRRRGLRASGLARRQQGLRRRQLHDRRRAEAIPARCSQRRNRRRRLAVEAQGAERQRPCPGRRVGPRVRRRRVHEGGARARTRLASFDTTTGCSTLLAAHGGRLRLHACDLGRHGPGLRRWRLRQRLRASPPGRRRIRPLERRGRLQLAPRPRQPRVRPGGPGRQGLRRGRGGKNSLFAWDATTAAQRWRKTSDGDFQALAVSDGIVYAGGHFNKFEGEIRRKLVALDAGTGALRRDWHPAAPHFGHLVRRLGGIDLRRYATGGRRRLRHRVRLPAGALRPVHGPDRRLARRHDAPEPAAG